jgi:hypothetical protein
MENDAITSWYLPIVLFQDEELEEATINMNVSQQSHKEKLIRRVWLILVWGWKVVNSKYYL